MKYAKSSFHKETLEENSTKPRRFWNTIKNVFPTKPKQMTTNLYRANDPDRPTMFSTYFASVVRMLKNKAIPLVDFVWRQPVALLSRTDKVFKITVISRAFIVNELKHFKRNKATGVDELPSGMLKDVREYISYPLCYILNLSVTTATVPITVHGNVQRSYQCINQDHMTNRKIFDQYRCYQSYQNCWRRPFISNI